MLIVLNLSKIENDIKTLMNSNCICGEIKRVHKSLFDFTAIRLEQL